jgi:hypothetical protein
MLIQILKIKFPSIFGQPLQHFTIDNIRTMNNILKNPPYHICHKNKTLTATFDISQDLDHQMWLDENKHLFNDPIDSYIKDHQHH